MSVSGDNWWKTMRKFILTFFMSVLAIAIVYQGHGQAQTIDTSAYKSFAVPPLQPTAGQFSGVPEAVIRDLRSGNTTRTRLTFSDEIVSIPKPDAPINNDVGIASPISPADLRVVLVTFSNPTGNYRCSGTVIGQTPRIDGWALCRKPGAGRIRYSTFSYSWIRQ